MTNGLGNQLFQFAFAHYLAKTLQSNILIENRPTTVNSPDVNFQLLDLFDYCTHINLKKHRAFGHKKKFDKLLYKTNLVKVWENFVLKTSMYTNVSEKEFADKKYVTDMSNDVKYSFEGFWQNWRYVDYVKDELTTDLFAVLNSRIATKVSKIDPCTKSLVIHVRRGDYTNPRFRKVFGIVRLDLYLPIVREIKTRYPNVSITTLTDDIDLLKNEPLKHEFGRVIGPNECNPWEAIKIMAAANFLITANSSLSWWGGFLSISSGGEVYIPDPWFIGENTLELNNYLHPKFKTYQSGLYKH